MNLFLQPFNFLLLLHFFNDGIKTAVIILLPFIAKELSINYTQIGILGSSFGLLALFLAIPTGIIASKFGGFKFLLTALLIYSLGVIGISISPSLLFLLPVFYLTAIGFGVFHIVGFTLVARSSTKENIGKNMANFTATGDIGRLAISSLALLIIPLWGWRITAIMLSSIGLFLYLTSKITNIDKNKDKSGQVNLNENRNDWLKSFIIILKTKKLFLVALTSFIDAFASNQLFIFLPFIFLARGINITHLSIYTGGYFVASFVGKTILGRAVDKYGSKIVFVASEFLMAVTLILFSISYNFILLFILSFLLGIFTKGTSPVIQTMFSEGTHETHYEKVYAISEIFIGAATTISPVIMGFTGDYFGVSSILYLSAAFALAAIFPILFIRQTNPIHKRYILNN